MIKHLLDFFSPFSRALKHRSSAYRRFHATCYAWKYLLNKKQSYSQWEEDKLILDYLRSQGGLREGWIYVDVGANHPISISDTYLFYQLGYNGVCIEPNIELAQLYRSIRPRDYVIAAAAGKEPGVATFYQTNNPVFSALDNKDLEDRVTQTNVVPLITLDQIIGIIKFDGVFLLKTDTEGFDFPVLQGAQRLLRKTLLVMTETRNETERAEHLNLLGADWEVLHAKANSIFLNKRIAALFTVKQMI